MATFKTIKPRRNIIETAHLEHVDVPVAAWHDARQLSEIVGLIRERRPDLESVDFEVLSPIHYCADGYTARISIRWTSEHEE